jgi:hypothetical protein
MFKVRVRYLSGYGRLAMTMAPASGGKKKHDFDAVKYY